MHSSPSKPIRLYLFSFPRTRSNLWMKLFERHPELHPIKYPMHDSWVYGPEHMRTRTTIPNLEEIEESHKHLTYQRGFDDLMVMIHEAESKGKGVFMKDHIFVLVKPATVAQGMDRGSERVRELRLSPLEGVYEKHADWRRSWKCPTVVSMPDHQVVTSNLCSDDPSGDSTPATNNTTANGEESPFIIPDAFVKTIRPVIIIRHPTHVLNSYYNVAPGSNGGHVDDTDFPILGGSYPLLRIMYDYFASIGNTPIVIDGDDIVRDPPRVAEKFCEVVGIDPAGVQYNWQPDLEDSTAVATLVPAQRAFMEGLITSTGIKIHTEEQLDPDIAKYEPRWAAKYGQEVASKLRAYVEASMEDYMFLRSKKL